MAAILQLRRGAISDFSSYGTNVSEPYFDTGRDTIHIGTVDASGSSADWITVAKLSQANRDFTKDEANTGSLWITGNYTGSNMYLSDDLSVSGSAWFSGDVHIWGDMKFGDNRPNDVITVRSEFSGSLIPDNNDDSDATSGSHDLGSDSKRWRNIYLQKDAAGSGFLSGSHIDLTGNIKVDGEGRFGTLKVDDLTDNRILLAGVGGEVEDDSNLTYDGQDFRLTNSDYYQSGSGASFQFSGAGGEITGSWTISELAVNDGIVFTNAEGTLDNSTSFTWNDTYVGITGGVSASQDISVGNEAYLQSAIVKDLTNDRVVIAGTNGELEDSVDFVFTDTELNIGEEKFTVQRSSGNTHTSGTLDVDGQSTLASANIEDLTSGRVVLAGTSGELEDSANLTFNGSLLTVTGDTTITGDLTVQGDTTQLNVSTLNVEDKNILIASGAADASAANGGGITIDGADATILYSSANDSFQLNKQLQVEGNISGSSFGGTTLLSSSNENFADYSQSVDSRLDAIEGPMSTSLDSRLIEIFATGSDHETRIDAQELHSSSFTSNDLDMNGNKVLFGNVYSTEGDLPSATDYHGMFAHVHGTGKGYFAHGGNWIPLLNESTFTTDSASFDSRLDAQESFSSALDDTFATEAEVNSATSSLSSSLAVDIASNLSEITNLNSFSESIESHLPSGTISGSSQITDGSGIVSGSGQLEGYVSSSTANVIEVMTSASYAAITPVSGTLYIIQG